MWQKCGNVAKGDQEMACKACVAKVWAPASLV